MRIHALLLGSILALSSCGQSPMSSIGSPVVKIVTDQATYSPGASALVRFTNLSSDSTLYLNGCLGYLERRQGTGWVRVNQASGDFGCTLPIKGLQPDSSATVLLPLAATLQPGTYRYLFTALEMPLNESLPEAERLSNVFQVQ